MHVYEKVIDSSSKFNKITEVWINKVILTNIYKWYLYLTIDTIF